MAEKKPRKPRKNDLTYACFLIIDGGAPIPWEETTEEQRATFRKRAQERLSINMSAYYSQHPDEYRRLCAELDAKEAARARARDEKDEKNERNEILRSAQNDMRGSAQNDRVGKDEILRYAQNDRGGGAVGNESAVR